MSEWLNWGQRAISLTAIFIKGDAKISASPGGGSIPSGASFAFSNFLLDWDALKTSAGRLAPSC